MGCASSKRVEASVVADVYRPPPTSVAVFDITKIEEPWLIAKTVSDEDDEEEEEEREQDMKPTIVPLPLLEKLESYEAAPKSWSEVSKALEDLKPTLTSLPPPPAKKDRKNPKAKNNSPEELETQAKKPPPLPRPSSPPRAPPPELAGFRSVKENSFILRDREERERQKSGDAAAAAKIPWWRRDPLDGYPELCPPGNADGVVLYTTTLRGVRRTFEDCERARRVLEGQALDVGVPVDERDVSLHGEFLRELRELLGEEEAAVPRLFVRGRYVGGVEEVEELGETGKLRDMLRWVARKGGRDEAGKGGRRDCEGCGGARFVPCLECNGSCKVLGEDGKTVERCGECNENGLMLCPLCH